MSFCSWGGSEKYKDHFKPGIYVCSKCESALFPATAKYKHSSPWPAFTDPISDDCLLKEVEHQQQKSSEATAYKVYCGKCKNGLGHEFLRDGPRGKSRF